MGSGTPGLRIRIALVGLLLLGAPCRPWAAEGVPPAVVGAPALVPLVTRLVEGALGPRPGATSRLRADELALTLIDLRTPGIPASASYRGDVQIYPASVVKLFYLGAAHRWMEDGRLQRSEELDRALRLMIVDSWNEASHYVLDLLTDTTSGPELAPEALEEWYRKRNAVNRYYESLGYRRVVANRKPWCEGPFGRERQSALQHAPYRNLLTTGETGRLLQEIVTRRMVTPARCDQMLSLLARDPVPKPNDPESQVKGFVGEGLPRGAKLWSKAGWTSDTRHDAACVELPDGRRFILVVFTTNHSEDEGLIPSIARQAVAGIPPLP